MPQFHQDTKHSYLSIRKNSFYLDWGSQPKNVKTYPHFHMRYPLANLKGYENLNLIGGITYQKEYPQGTYYLRTNPSAGGLYPCEIYLQVRGVEGMVSGIYHYEPLNGVLCLIHEISKDGVEYYFKHQGKQKGFTFLISSVYFRSSWKYRDRAIRYILLDSGHALGAIYATLCMMGLESEINFDFDKLALNDIFGFRDDEMFTVALFATTQLPQETKAIVTKLPFVAGADYLETNPFIQEAYKISSCYDAKPISKMDFFKDIPSNALKQSIIHRRSIRAFHQIPISNEEFNFIFKDIFTFASLHDIDIFYTVHRVQDKMQGLYKNTQLLKEGDFSMRSRYLSLEQNIGGASAVTLYFTSSQVEAYQKVNILSGFLAQIIYLKAEFKHIGCSGIGAYYDDETKDFLGTSNNILYLLAVGR